MPIRVGEPHTDPYILSYLMYSWKVEFQVNLCQRFFIIFIKPCQWVITELKKTRTCNYACRVCLAKIPGPMRSHPQELLSWDRQAGNVPEPLKSSSVVLVKLEDTLCDLCKVKYLSG